jgi:PqqD family protein of HPr-rel-A system
MSLVARRLPGLVEAEVDGELVALHIENGSYYGFNATAARIWALLDHPKSVTEICAALAAEFDVDAQECDAQVRLLLQDLQKDGLVDLTEHA